MVYSATHTLDQWTVKCYAQKKKKKTVGKSLAAVPLFLLTVVCRQPENKQSILSTSCLVLNYSQAASACLHSVIDEASSILWERSVQYFNHADET